MILCCKVVYVYLFKQNLEKMLKICGKSSKNIWKKFQKIWEDYIVDINIGLYKGTLEHILHTVCMEGACKSVQLHNIGSVCMTALPYSNLSDMYMVTKPHAASYLQAVSYFFKILDKQKIPCLFSKRWKKSSKNKIFKFFTWVVCKISLYWVPLILLPTNTLVPTEGPTLHHSSLVCTSILIFPSANDP